MSIEYLVFAAIAVVFFIVGGLLWLRGAFNRFKPDGVDANEKRKLFVTSGLAFSLVVISLVIGQFFIQASDSQRTQQLAGIINGFARTLAGDLENQYREYAGDDARLQQRLDGLLQYNEIMTAIFVVEQVPEDSGRTRLRRFSYRGLSLVGGPSADGASAQRELGHLQDSFGLMLEGDAQLQSAFAGTTVFDTRGLQPGSSVDQFRVITPLFTGSGAIHAVVVFQLDRSLLSEGLLQSRALIITLMALVMVVIGFAFWYVMRKRMEHLEVERNRQRFESLASRDYLTGIWNRYRFEEICTAEIDRSRRYDRKLSLLICDVDGFKTINDRFGRNTADAVLIDMASIIKGQLRASDVFGRWGGDEFALLCPETDAAGAQQVANKVIEQVRNRVFATVDTVRCSIGITSYRPDDTLQSLVYRASNALYAAKSGGKNQVKML